MMSSIAGSQINNEVSFFYYATAGTVNTDSATAKHLITHLSSKIRTNKRSRRLFDECYQVVKRYW